MNTAIRIMLSFQALALSPMLLFTGTLAVSAPTLAESNPALAKSRKALLGKYPAGRLYKGRRSAVDLRSHKDAGTFRTRLLAAAKNRPNFAGHMIVTSWGCGTACQIIALIDARTGKVSFGPTASAGIAHRLTSRLLIVNPPETIAEAYGNKPPGWLKTRYYLWKGGRLLVLKHP